MSGSALRRTTTLSICPPDNWSQAIRERKEAQEAAARAEAEAKTAEEARAKMEEDMKLLNARLSGAQEDREQAARPPPVWRPSWKN